MNSPKVKDSPVKRLNKDEMNEKKRLHLSHHGLHMQLSYSWLNKFC